VSFVLKAVLATLGFAAGAAGYLQYQYPSVGDLDRLEVGTKGTSLSGPARQYIELRVKADEVYRSYADPSCERLLPDLPPEHDYVKTLVLDLDDVLVKSDWNRQRGWKTFKRPGVEGFLRQMAQYYEVVVYTGQLSSYTEPIMERLDPQRYVSYRLCRDATRYTNGEHVRDLAALNRDPAKVIYLSANPKSYQLQPENALPIKGWGDLDPKDTTLLDLMPFLESIVRYRMQDTRTVIASYKQEMEETGKEVPEIYRNRMQNFQKRAAEAKGTGGGFKPRKKWF